MYLTVSIMTLQFTSLYSIICRVNSSSIGTPEGSLFKYGNYTPILKSQQDITLLEIVSREWFLFYSNIPRSIIRREIQRTFLIGDEQIVICSIMASAVEAGRAHNPKVVGSNPTPATN